MAHDPALDPVMNTLQEAPERMALTAREEMVLNPEPMESHTAEKEKELTRRDQQKKESQAKPTKEPEQVLEETGPEMATGKAKGPVATVAQLEALRAETALEVKEEQLETTVLVLRPEDLGTRKELLVENNPQVPVGSLERMESPEAMARSQEQEMVTLETEELVENEEEQEKEPEETRTEEQPGKMEGPVSPARPEAMVDLLHPEREARPEKMERIKAEELEKEPEDQKMAQMELTAALEVMAPTV